MKVYWKWNLSVFNPPLTETFPRSRLPEMGSYLTPTYCKHTIMRTILKTGNESTNVD